ncbi:MAG: FGGY-family carbohydrate kinase [Candidatus Thorarchaeota archaeon]
MPVAAIDAGTTGVRCMIAGGQGEVLGLGRRTWGYETPEFLEIAKEFDPPHFWDLICTVTKEAVKASGLPSSKIDSVATTSQRHGVVFLDADGKELYGGPNIDARGAMSQYVVEEALGKKFLEVTGCWPPMMFTPARMAWFEEEAPEIREAVAHVLPINDWITFRLSGEYVTEPASASATGCYDIKSKNWSKEIFSALGIDKSIFPSLRKAGDLVGSVKANAAKDSGLPEGLPVIQGGTDTHCALLAAQASPGEITVIAGSTTPVMLTLDNHVCSSEQTLWSSCHMVPGMWTLESNAMLTGAYIEWVIALLCELSEDPVRCREKTLDSLPQLLKDIPPGSNEAYAGLGPRIMDSTRMADIPLARLHFPQPALPQVKPLDSASLIHAVLENIAFAVRGNIEQLQEYSDPPVVKAIGGISRSQVWRQILSNAIRKPVMNPREFEGSLIGAAICAAVGAGWYPNLRKASEAMVTWQPTLIPDERASEYDFYYSRWKEIWSLGSDE